MENLTERQQQVLDFIVRCIGMHGAPPTLREISAHIGTRGTVTALHHIEAIEKKGYLRRREGSSRGIVLTEKAGRPIRLQPENRNMKPILIRESDAEAVIIGKLLKTIRNYDK